MSLNSHYEKHPTVVVADYDDQAYRGYPEIAHALNQAMLGKRSLVIDCYPGVRVEEIIERLVLPMGITEIFLFDDAFIPGEEITKKIERNLTDDRVFGVLSTHRLEEFIDSDALDSLKERTALCNDRYCVIGVGASLIGRADVLVYADLARWEIQQRYRSQEIGNWKCSNHKEDILRKYKRGFFVEWRMADRHKRDVFARFDFLLDTNTQNDPKLVTSTAFLDGLKQTSRQPFRTVPFFDPGVWGGQWMKEVCRLDPDKDNYAWCFDGVPEENSLLLQYGETIVQVPSIDLVFMQAGNLLGESVHARFGLEFPIRFDFLDTMDGQHLSLQVHPLTEYIQENFGMHYTQDESYYILDAKDDGTVYLGVKEGIDPKDMIADLKAAQQGSTRFPDEKYINRFPAKKHDHFLIPAGTVHCSGKNAMILEISATPYIFTFKLWDWDRVGLDGLPRPVHIGHGEKVIQFDRDTTWVKENLINRFETKIESKHHLEEKTGLHEREFIETRRHTFDEPIELSTQGTVQMLNLIEGREIVVESMDHSFQPYRIHYAETFIIPASVGKFRLRPLHNESVKVIRAYVR